jgi:hypothetical protein
MRAIIMAVVVAAAVLAGFLVYRGNSSAPQQTMFATTAPAAARQQQAACTVDRAVYRYNEAEVIRLSFRRIASNPSESVELSNDITGRQVGNMMFVIYVTSFGKTYEFRPVNQASTGPEYQSFVLYVRPQSGGGGPMPVQLFTSDMHIIRDLPRNDSIAPSYIIMPDLMRRLYSEHIDLPNGAFRLSACEPAAPPAATP